MAIFLIFIISDIPGCSVRISQNVGNGTVYGWLAEEKPKNSSFVHMQNTDYQSFSNSGPAISKTLKDVLDEPQPN